MRRGRWFNRRSELDSYRSQPRKDFVVALSQRLTGTAPTSPRLRSRLAFAGAISVFVLGTFASLGGLGYAASGATGTYGAVKQVAVKHTLIVSVHKSSAADEYAPKPKPKPHKKKVKPVHQTGVAGAQTGVGIAGVKTSGTLPFTGLSLLATLVLSMALLVAGIILRRRERRN
jgi:hypothetical protein